MSSHKARRKLGEAYAVREADEGGAGDVVKLVLVPCQNDVDNFYGAYEEFVWARKIETRGDRAVYELQNNAYFHPLVKGDKVTASPGQWSRLQVDGVVKLRKGHSAAVILNSELFEEEIVEYLGGTATHLEGGSGILVGFWKQGTTPMQLEQIAENMPTRSGYFKISSTPRRRMLIEKTLETKVSGPTEDDSPYTDYWAADDPNWTEGFDDPETLSRVQMMVYEDPMVLALINNGLRGNILAYMDILDSSEPFERPEPGWYLASQGPDLIS